jgi:hypothetical protein
VDRRRVIAHLHTFAFGYRTHVRKRKIASIIATAAKGHNGKLRVSRRAAAIWRRGVGANRAQPCSAGSDLGSGSRRPWYPRAHQNATEIAGFLSKANPTSWRARDARRHDEQTSLDDD